MTDAQSISIHALLAESDDGIITRGQLPTPFLSTLSLRRATISGLRHKCASFYFYPRSPCGERPYQRAEKQANQSISIHALLAESDNVRSMFVCKKIISIHALLAESDDQTILKVYGYGISIHALLAESDGDSCYLDNIEISISIHALLAESDYPKGYRLQNQRQFLSTLSLRRATYMGVTVLGIQHNFYPRSPCGERLYDTYAKVLRVNISIHALLAESDPQTNSQTRTTAQNFYPRSPCGERL